MNQAQIGENVKALLEDYEQSTFVFDLLRAFGFPKPSITRLKNGGTNLASADSDVVLKRHLFFRHEINQDLHDTIELMKNDVPVTRHKARFVICTNFDDFLAIDTKTKDTLDIKLSKLPQHYHFFLPWAGMEKTSHANEIEADVKASEKMAKLFDLIREINPSKEPEDIHALNVFLTRLLFCYFAEDTEIFAEQVFTNAIASHTEEDGSDLKDYLEKLFLVLNTPKDKRDGLPAYYDDFYYVNGGLFANSYPVPKFSRKSRRMIIECGELQWAEINPDIFGSMFQAVIDPEERGDKGMHYTSVPNIMKVIEPLFLNELREELESNIDNERKLESLLQRIYKLKIFDPACGSGNFLIIAYKELRTLEMQIFSHLEELRDQKSLLFSEMKLSQFYGIEIDDFAHEIAILSLWLAEHQMNVKFKEVFGDCRPSLPLKEAGNVVCDNATRLDWEEVCPQISDETIYILGNPPYRGTSRQSPANKADVKFVLSNLSGYKKLDYIACWFFKAVKYIHLYGARSALVSTNSICQGEQVSTLWPSILELDVEICFAYQSFKWTNNAKKNAGVTCVIVGLQKKSLNKKTIYTKSFQREVDNINPYLISGRNILVQQTSSPLSERPQISRGNIPNDGGHLILSQDEKNHLLKTIPQISENIKKFFGPQEYIKGIKRWILWIEDKDVERLSSYAEIIQIFANVSKARLKSDKNATKELAKTPHRYELISYCKKTAIFIPRTSSENRDYIPMGFLAPDDIIGDAQAIYNPSPFILGVISSRMHMSWVKAVAGRFKTDFRYSSRLVYNTFPFPGFSKNNREKITNCTLSVISQREAYPEKTMAQLYDPKNMPDGLRDAHEELDLVVERCYRSKPFTSDEERLEHLFKLYEEMTAKEQQGGLI